jgi:hypothetical protein
MQPSWWWLSLSRVSIGEETEGGIRDANGSIRVGVQELHLVLEMNRAESSKNML